MSISSLSVALIYPEVLGTYGDRGNAEALRHRAAARGIDVHVLEVSLPDPIPVSADLYLLGGGEDAGLLLAWRALDGDPGLVRAIGRGAPCLGVCAGFQLLGRDFTGPDHTVRPGLGMLDVSSRRLRGPRAVGEVLANSSAVPVGFLSGFENHQGDARLGPDATPLGNVVVGVGNGYQSQEGAVQGRVIGTYLHGPVLVRNAALADHLLELVAGPLAPFEDEAIDRLRSERQRDALAGSRRGWGAILRVRSHLASGGGSRRLRPAGPRTAEVRGGAQ